MKTTKFGENITYKKGNKLFKDKLSNEIKERKFSDFSPEGITSYLTFRHPVGKYTMFRDYQKFPFGYSENGCEWYPSFNVNNDDFETSIKKTEKLMLDSIKELTRDMEKIAVTISGGLDSSLIASMLRRIYPQKELYSYCAGFYGDDEFEYARMVAEENNFIHKEFRLGKDDFLGKNSILKKLIEFKAAPLHPNELPLAYVEKEAKSDGMEIVLCGEGADDIFGGYGQNLRMYLNYDYKESFFKFFLDRYRYFSLEDREIIKDEYLVDDFSLTIESLHLENIDYDIRNWAFYFTQVLHTPGLITRGANAMRFNDFPLGFPYINDELVRFVNSLPFDYKIAWKSDDFKKKSEDKSYKEITENYDIPKMILKKIAESYLDEKIIYRTKKGFPVPFDLWLKDVNTWNLNSRVFKSNNISSYNGWKKFMLINLSIFCDIFEKQIGKEVL